MILPPTTARPSDTTWPSRAESNGGFDRDVMNDSMLAALGRLVVADLAGERLARMAVTQAPRRVRPCDSSD